MKNKLVVVIGIIVGLLALIMTFSSAQEKPPGKRVSFYNKK